MLSITTLSVGATTCGYTEGLVRIFYDPGLFSNAQGENPMPIGTETCAGLDSGPKWQRKNQPGPLVISELLRVCSF